MPHSKGQATIDMEEMDDLMCLEYLEKTKNVKPIYKQERRSQNELLLTLITLYKKQQPKYFLTLMAQPNYSALIELFHVPTNQYRKKVQRLIKESVSLLGEAPTLSLIKQWETLSSKLDSLSQLRSLNDRNHRLMLIEFIKSESVKLYNNSYFNHAKISETYLSYLQSLGPYYFTQTIKIVNKLKLIYKHYHSKLHMKQFSENHIDIKIMRLLEMCDGKKRKGNSNLNKFQAIVEIQEDRDDLTKELGKMLRIAWALEKKEVVEVERSRRNENSRNSYFHELIEVESINGQNFFNESDFLYLCQCGFD